MKIEECTHSGHLFLYVKPVGDFEIDGTHFWTKGIYIIVICVYQKQIGQGGKSPLQTGVDTKIIPLIAVLHQGGPEQGSGKRNFNPGHDQPDICRRVWVGKGYLIVIYLH